MEVIEKKRLENQNIIQDIQPIIELFIADIVIGNDY
jgi:hypothetical protein